MDTKFICPYANKELATPCTVDSCNFNMGQTPLADTYRRCFLNYIEALRYNPAGKSDLGDQYGSLPLRQRAQLISNFFGISEREVMKSNGEFYSSMFSIIAQDTNFFQNKFQLDPVPYRQCAVCGEESDRLFIPQSGALPPGWGYCGYTCYLLKPPPFLVIEKSLELDISDLMKNLEYDNSDSRAKFVRQIILWVFGNIPML